MLVLSCNGHEPTLLRDLPVSDSLSLDVPSLGTGACREAHALMASFSASSIIILQSWLIANTEIGHCLKHCSIVQSELDGEVGNNIMYMCTCEENHEH